MELFKNKDLSCGVNDFGEELLATKLNDLVEGVFDGGIIGLDKMVFNKPNCHRALP